LACLRRTESSIPHPRFGSRIALLAFAAAPVSALAQTSQATPGPSILPMLLALAFVLALIPLAVWVMKKLGGAQPALAQSAGLQVITQLPLGARERVVVLEAGDRWLLLGVTAAAINRIGTLPKPAAADAPAAPASATAFRQLLQQIRAGR
jgi:flagellar protein FliO/FliZ